ncbi:MAG TPA: YggT family protein [Candidatus Hypogeohydataceae bacterium YC40]
MTSSPIHGIISLYELILFVRIFLGWIPHEKDHPVTEFLYKITEPVLEPVRKVIPPVGNIDASPLAVFFCLELLKRIILF